ncbi:MAG: tRNA dihydrouridine synthase DusB [Clostridia bacterium]|nr:tRNA dihydrouridine synthase DusB [Clostridia bacterium]
MAQILLAPLCGVTDYVYRTLCFEQGCDAAYTEMVSAMGYLCAPEQQATKALMKRGPQEKKLILQLFGKDPDTVAEAAGRISGLGIYDGIDLNMGCPARKVACSGEGSGLLKDPVRAGRMMEKTVRASSLPVSVKMRIGWDSGHINAVEIARIAENAGICEITVHGRTREQQYSGTADWNRIEEVKESVGIPVYGNGDIFTAEDAEKRLQQSHVDGVMIGRGALGNPWIFREIIGRMNGKPPEPVTPEEKYEMISRQYRMMLDSRPPHIAVREMRKHIGWYIHGLRGSAKIRNEINRCPDPDGVFALLKDFLAESAEAAGEENKPGENG